MVTAERAFSLKVAGSSASTTALAAAVSSSPWEVHAPVCVEACRITSGTSPLAAPVTRAWSWSAPAIGTISTAIPVSSVKASATAS
ncbi:Uncharacterised protein [Mycobacterium tuberculosis]|nr:Uncharacterised protein [Mycobacterium tuberculosis]